LTPQEFAEQLIYSHAQDIEHLTLSELAPAGFTENDLDKTWYYINTANIEVSWPDNVD
jgi:hypothetical protein